MAEWFRRKSEKIKTSDKREIAEGHLDNDLFHATQDDMEKELADELAKSLEE